MVCRLDFYNEYHADGLAFNSDITIIVHGEGTGVNSYSIMLELIIHMIPPDSLHAWK